MKTSSTSSPSPFGRRPFEISDTSSCDGWQNSWIGVFRGRERCWCCCKMTAKELGEADEYVNGSISGGLL